MKRVSLKNFSLLILLSIILCSLFVFTACNSNSEAFVVSAELISLPKKTEYIRGQGLDLSNGKILLIYNDETTQEYDFTVDDVSGYDPQKLGPQILTFTYNIPKSSANPYGDTFTETFLINVIEKIDIGFEVKKPIKTEYIVEDKLDLAGMSVNLIFNDDSKSSLTLNEYEMFWANTKSKVKDGDSLRFTDTQITVKYKNYSTSFDITVYKSIDISSQIISKFNKLISNNLTENEAENNLYVYLDYEDIFSNLIISKISVGNSEFFANHQNYLYKYSNEIQKNFLGYKLEDSYFKISTLFLFNEYYTELQNKNSRTPPETISFKIISEPENNSINKRIAYKLNFTNNSETKKIKTTNINISENAPIGVLSGNYVYSEKNNTFTNSRIHIDSGIGLKLKLLSSMTNTFLDTDNEIFKNTYFLQMVNDANEQVYFQRSSFNENNSEYSMELFNYKYNDTINSIIPKSKNKTYTICIPDIGLTTITVKYLEAKIKDISFKNNNIETQAVIGEELNTQNLTITATLSNNIKDSAGKNISTVELSDSECRILKNKFYYHNTDFSFVFSMQEVDSTENIEVTLNEDKFYINGSNIFTTIKDAFNAFNEITSNASNYYYNYVSPLTTSFEYYNIYLNSISDNNLIYYSAPNPIDSIKNNLAQYIDIRDHYDNIKGTKKIMITDNNIYIANKVLNDYADKNINLIFVKTDNTGVEIPDSSNEQIKGFYNATENIFANYDYYVQIDISELSQTSMISSITLNGTSYSLNNNIFNVNEKKQIAYIFNGSEFYIHSALLNEMFNSEYESDIIKNITIEYCLTNPKVITDNTINIKIKNLIKKTLEQDITIGLEFIDNYINANLPPQQIKDFTFISALEVPEGFNLSIKIGGIEYSLTDTNIKYENSLLYIKNTKLTSTEDFTIVAVFTDSEVPNISETLLLAQFDKSSNKLNTLYTYIQNIENFSEMKGLIFNEVSYNSNSDFEFYDILHNEHNLKVYKVICGKLYIANQILKAYSNNSKRYIYMVTENENTLLSFYDSETGLINPTEAFVEVLINVNIYGLKISNKIYAKNTNLYQNKSGTKTLNTIAWYINSNGNLMINAALLSENKTAYNGGFRTSITLLTSSTDKVGKTFFINVG